MNLADRFWAKVDKTDSSGCWIWTASRWKSGYGRIGVNGHLEGAHRVAWELTRGPIPAGLNVCHSCDNRPCVNPAHLFLGTQSDNIRDSIEKERWYMPIGEKNGRAKLTYTQVEEIRSSALPFAKLAVKYGVSRWTIWNIRKNVSWKQKEEDN